MIDGLTVPMKNVRPMPTPAARTIIESAKPPAVHTSAFGASRATSTPADEEREHDPRQPRADGDRERVDRLDEHERVVLRDDDRCGRPTGIDGGEADAPVDEALLHRLDDGLELHRDGAVAADRDRGVGIALHRGHEVADG